MFLRVARSVHRNLMKKREEVGDKEVQRVMQHQLEGMVKVISSLEQYQSMLISEGFENNRFNNVMDVDGVVGRLVLLQYLKNAEKRIKRQRKELKRLNRDNEYLRSRLRYDLCTMKDSKARWTILNETSPSGKTLFCCKVCGRISVTPDKGCRTTSDPNETLECSKWPNNLKTMNRDARWVNAANILEKVVNDLALEEFKDKRWEHVYEVYHLLTQHKSVFPWKATDKGARELAEVIEEELLDLSKAPQQRAQQIEKLIELCGEVKRGKLAGQAWGGK